MASNLQVRTVDLKQIIFSKMATNLMTGHDNTIHSISSVEKSSDIPSIITLGTSGTKSQISSATPQPPVVESPANAKFDPEELFSIASMMETDEESRRWSKAWASKDKEKREQRSDKSCANCILL